MGAYAKRRCGTERTSMVAILGATPQERSLRTEDFDTGIVTIIIITINIITITIIVIIIITGSTTELPQRPTSSLMSPNLFITSVNSSSLIILIF